MIEALPLIGLGLLVIIGNLLKKISITKKIPDIIPLICIGIVIGPVAGLLKPSDLGIVGPIFSLMTLVLILFEGGISLKIQEIMGSLRGAALLAVFTFCTTAIISAGLLMAVFGETRMTALIFGCILGGLSPAVVLPLTRQLSISDKTRTILTIESALADVLCIVAVISLINISTVDLFTPIDALLNLGESFFIAIGTGLFGGFIWVAFREQFKDIETIFTTPAFICILYGLTELFEGSGAISVLVFGIMIGNLCLFDRVKINGIEYCPRNQLTQKEVELFNQVADLLKTFFFIYIGISIVFLSPYMILFCIMVLVVIHLFRIPVAIATISNQVPKNDFYIISGMIPKGLATAVVASLPIQYGIPGTEKLEPLVYSIVIFSIFSSTIFAYFFEKKKVKENDDKEPEIFLFPLNAED